MREVGEAAAGSVAARLMGELTAAMAQGGPEKAVDVCHTRALPLTAAPVPGEPRVQAVKRTSLRLRNPANAPDGAERAALDHVAALLRAGRPVPAALVQKVERPGADLEWRFYRPVTVQAACLACHGPIEGQSAALRTLLRQRYPADAATGYAVGEWRGLVRVSVAAPSSR